MVAHLNASCDAASLSVRNRESVIRTPLRSVVPMENITVAQCFIAVDDHDKALVFYRDVVGLEVRQDVSNGGGCAGFGPGAAGQPDLGIVIEPPLADPEASDADKKAAADLLKKGYLEASTSAPTTSRRRSPA